MGRGESIGNGNSLANGPGRPYAWKNGFEAPRPVSWWEFMEGREPR